MVITDPIHLKLQVALEKLMQKRIELLAKYKNTSFDYGAACSPRPAGYVETDSLLGRQNFEWPDLIRKENDEVNNILHEILQTMPQVNENEIEKITPEKIWVWGGPTPKWGGSMNPDALVRGADYFQAENVVYAYGPTTDEMLQKHAKYKKVLCQVNSNCRTAGALFKSEEENAELLSLLSLKYTNIVGAICDDYCTGSALLLLPDRFERIYCGVKKYNKNLKVYGVIYAHELYCMNFQMIQPYLDVVNFWLWHKDDILDIDHHLAVCRENFPGKPIVIGLFIHDYGRASVAIPPELLVYELRKVREFLTKGWIEGLVIMGDREIKKWPQETLTVKDYLSKQ